MKILHLVVDDKFYEGPRNFFDSIRAFENTYVLYVPDKKCQLRYIKNTQGLLFCSSMMELAGMIRKGNFSCVYLHSLSPKRYKLIFAIPRGVKIIWWIWGYDMYSSYRMLPPLVEIPLYKEQTNRFFKKKESDVLLSWLKMAYFSLLYPYDKFRRNYVLKRIQYYSPVLPVEFECLKEAQKIKGELFWSAVPKRYSASAFSCFPVAQNILVGNSATPTNNHIDVLSILKNMPKAGTIIVPMSYGNGLYRDFVKSYINKSFDVDAVRVLDTFMPLDEYNALIKTCSHAIFGNMRQQAVGNIHLCLKSGVKVFFYKDSILYKQFKELSGFYVYTIEDDLNEEELSTPLSVEKARYNYDLIYSKITSEQDAISFVEQEFKKIEKT